jgi:hypothetical protein
LTSPSHLVGVHAASTSRRPGRTARPPRPARLPPPHSSRSRRLGALPPGARPSSTCRTAAPLALLPALHLRRRRSWQEDRGHVPRRRPRRGALRVQRGHRRCSVGCRTCEQSARRLKSASPSHAVKECAPTAPVGGSEDYPSPLARSRPLQANARGQGGRARVCLARHHTEGQGRAADRGGGHLASTDNDQVAARAVDAPLDAVAAVA